MFLVAWRTNVFISGSGLQESDTLAFCACGRSWKSWFPFIQILRIPTEHIIKIRVNKIRLCLVWGNTPRKMIFSGSIVIFCVGPKKYIREYVVICGIIFPLQHVGFLCSNAWGINHVTSPFSIFFFIFFLFFLLISILPDLTEHVKRVIQQSPEILKAHQILDYLTYNSWPLYNILWILFVA